MGDNLVLERSLCLLFAAAEDLLGPGAIRGRPGQAGRMGVVGIERRFSTMSSRR